jgi:hypothetical protein
MKWIPKLVIHPIDKIVLKLQISGHFSPYHIILWWQIFNLISNVKYFNQISNSQNSTYYIIIISQLFDGPIQSPTKTKLKLVLNIFLLETN